MRYYKNTFSSMFCFNFFALTLLCAVFLKYVHPNSAILGKYCCEFIVFSCSLLQESTQRANVHRLGNCFMVDILPEATWAHTSGLWVYDTNHRATTTPKNITAILGEIREQYKEKCSVDIEDLTKPLWRQTSIIIDDDFELQCDTSTYLITSLVKTSVSFRPSFGPWLCETDSLTVLAFKSLCCCKTEHKRELTSGLSALQSLLG